MMRPRRFCCRERAQQEFDRPAAGSDQTFTATAPRRGELDRQRRVGAEADRGGWVKSIGLDRTPYGTHAMRRTKVAHIYRKTGNLRAVQLPLGHTRMDSTVRNLGVELEDALAKAEAVET